MTITVPDFQLGWILGVTVSWIAFAIVRAVKDR